MKDYPIAIDTFLEGNYRKAGELIRLSEARAKVYVDAGQITDPDAPVEDASKTPRGKKSET